jgi:hypothetical protein
MCAETLGFGCCVSWVIYLFPNKLLESSLFCLCEYIMKNNGINLNYTSVYIPVIYFSQCLNKDNTLYNVALNYILGNISHVNTTKTKQFE